VDTGYKPCIPARSLREAQTPKAIAAKRQLLNLRPIPKQKRRNRETPSRPLYFFSQVSYAWQKEKPMEMRYTYETDGKFLVGYLDEYPEHPTQAFSIEELEENLKDIFALIQDGTLEAKKHGVLQLA
jgi:predicted RNase H-like HicB family nuclease